MRLTRAVLGQTRALAFRPCSRTSGGAPMVRAGQDKRAAPKAASSAECGRKLRRQTSDQITAKALADNLRNWSNEDLYIREVGGVTLSARVKQDLKKKKDDPSFIMGARYYRALKDIYKPPSDPTHALVAPSEPQPVNPTLLKGMIAARKQRKDFTILQSYLGAAPMPNQTEIVGIYKWALTLNPNCSRQTTVALDVCRYVARLDLGKAFVSETDLLFSFFDKTLVAARKQAKQMPCDVFCKLHSKIVRLVIPAESLDNVLACGSSWADVADELSKIVESSELGSMMYSFAVLKILSDKVQAHIQANILKLSAAAMTVDTVNKCKFTTLKELQQLPNINLLPSKRCITFEYAGYLIPATVTTLAGEVNLCFSAMVKSKALVAPKPIISAKGHIHPDLVAPAVIARNRFDDIHSEAGADTADTVLATVRQHIAALLVVDADFGVEQALVEHLCGASSEDRLLNSILETFPTKDKSVTLESCLQAVTILGSGDCFRLASRTAQAKHGMIVKILSRLLDNREPDLSAIHDDKIMQAMVVRLGFFVTASVGKGTKAITLYGAEAVANRLEAIIAKNATAKCQPSEVDFLRAWRYLICKNKLPDVDALLKDIDASAVSHTKLQGGKKSGRSAPKDTKQDAAVAEAMALFS